MSNGKSAVVAVVIPSYKVSAHILDVISRIGTECAFIYVVDDACPEQTGNLVEAKCTDQRVKVLRHSENQGVGGAVLTGYQQAAMDGADVIVKIDGDGQMAPELLPAFIEPILSGEADYTKGNRFYDLDDVRSMPAMRLFGNTVLSFMTKFSSGYWNIFDPTNGYTAIHGEVVSHLCADKISKRYFFESDMLFRLNTIRAVVVDIPMTAVYADEKSNLVIRKIFKEFLLKHCKNFGKRIFYNYFLRDMSIASIELVLGIPLMMFGSLFGAYHWEISSQTGVSASAGTVMVAALSILTGLQLLLSFLSFDINSVPKQPRFSGRIKKRTKDIQCPL